MTRPLALFAGVLCTAAALTGCSPTGDFGRPAPSVLHDKVLPLVGAGQALHRNETVTFLPLTENERALRAHAYTIVVARDILGSAQSVKPYLRYRRIVRPWPHTTPVNAYHDRVLRLNFAATETRFNKILGDMQKDRNAIAPFDRAATRVIEDDGVRRGLLEQEAGITDMARSGAEARMTDNDRVIGLACATMVRRLKAYSYALQHLAIETPTRRLHTLETSFRELEVEVENLTQNYSRSSKIARRFRNQDPLVLIQSDIGRSPGQPSVPHPYSLANPR